MMMKMMMILSVFVLSSAGRQRSRGGNIPRSASQSKCLTYSELQKLIVKLKRLRGSALKKIEEREEISFKETINSRKIRRGAHVVLKGI
jgi:hypothetical protein